VVLGYDRKGGSLTDLSRVSEFEDRHPDTVVPSTPQTLQLHYELLLDPEVLTTVELDVAPDMSSDTSDEKVPAAPPLQRLAAKSIVDRAFQRASDMTRNKYGCSFTSTYIEGSESIPETPYFVIEHQTINFTFTEESPILVPIMLNFKAFWPLIQFSKPMQFDNKGLSAVSEGPSDDLMRQTLREKGPGEVCLEFIRQLKLPGGNTEMLATVMNKIDLIVMGSLRVSYRVNLSRNMVAHPSFIDRQFQLHVRQPGEDNWQLYRESGNFSEWINTRLKEIHQRTPEHL
ncbi:hypothetical protein FOL47_011309, partial [Perkinsus chesapeaki]